MGLGFTALGLLPLPEATALGYAAPLLTVIFAAMFLGEEVRVFRLSAVAIGLVGVVIVLAPRLTVTAVDDATSRCRRSARWPRSAALSSRRWRRSSCASSSTPSRPATIVFYFSVTASVLALVTLPFGWVVPTAARGGAARRRRASSAASGRSC